MSESNPIIAINQSKIVNRPESFETMMTVGPKVCRGPYYMVFAPMMEQGLWRRHLVQ